MAVGRLSIEHCAFHNARDDVFANRRCCGGYGGGDVVVARRAGVSAPYQRARTAMERRPYHLGHHIGSVLSLCCRMVDVAEDGAGWGGDE
jgi:hypothetical protein